jgi:hypothetical protein
MKKFVVVVVVLVIGAYVVVRMLSPVPGLKRELQELRQTVATLNLRETQREAELAVLRSKLEDEEKNRKLSEARVQELEGEQAQLLQENTLYKQQIHQLNDVQIAEQIGSRIGQEEVGVEIRSKWTFTLTRLGGEKTLGIFKDERTWFSLAESRGTEIVELKGQVESLNVSLKLEQQITLQERQGKEEAKAALAQSMSTLHDVQKASIRKSTKSFLTGALVGAVVVGVLTWKK